MAARLSPMMRDMLGSLPRHSLLHPDYAIRGSSTLDHTSALIRIVRHSSVNDYIFISPRRQINRQFKGTLSCCFAKMTIVAYGRRNAAWRNVHNYG